VEIPIHPTHTEAPVTQTLMEALVTQTHMDPRIPEPPEAQEVSILPTPVAQIHMVPVTHQDRLVDMVEMTPPTPRPDMAQATPDQTTTTITTAAAKRMTPLLASC